MNTKFNIRNIALLAFTVAMLTVPFGVASAQTNSSDDGLGILGVAIYCFSIIIALVGWGGGSFWIYKDANARGQNGVMWAVILAGFGVFGLFGTFILSIIGLFCCNIPGIFAVVYYFTQRPEPAMNAEQYPPGTPMM